MKKVIRHQQILELLNKNGIVETKTLSSLLYTSELTIRKDLNELYDRGKLQRQYGGARSIITTELPISERQKRNFMKKKAIGKAAAVLVKDGDSLFIDGGTTTEQIIENLASLNGLVVITNSINILNKLMHSGNINIYVPEGKIDITGFSIIGSLAENALQKYNARISFIGVDGVTSKQGLLNNSFEATSISRIMLKNSQTKVLLVDSSKFEIIGSIKLCDLKDIDVLITDKDVPQEYVNICKDLNIQIIIADE